VVRAALPAAGAEIPNRPEIGQTLMQGATDPKAAQKAYERIQHWTTIRRRLMCDEIGYRAVVREHLGEWRQYWADGIRMEEYTADSAGLAEFINDYPLDEYRTAYLDAHGGEVREQVAGQATFDYVTRARPLLSYEQHLDGKTKATIETLLALQRARLGG
jgi:hypothetical protein